MDYENVLFQKEAGVGIVTLNRPRALNATNYQLVSELSQLWDEIEQDEEVRAVIITGSSQAFAAGGDVKYMSNASPLEMERFITLAHEMHDKIAFSSKPAIAAVAGLALGGGCELALACDIRVAADNAKFGQPEINLGIIPGAGGTQRLSRLVGVGWARHMIMTGIIIDANKALNIGLVTKVVPVDELMNEANRIARQLASKSPLAMSSAKKCMNYTENVDLVSGLTYERKSWAFLFCSQDQKEGMNAFLEKRKPQFNGR